MLLLGGCGGVEKPPTSRNDSLVVEVAGRWVQRQKKSHQQVVTTCWWWWWLVGGCRDKDWVKMTCSSLMLMVGGCDDKENPPTSCKDSLVVVVADRWVQRQRTSQKWLVLGCCWWLVGAETRVRPTNKSKRLVGGGCGLRCWGRGVGRYQGSF